MAFEKKRDGGATRNPLAERILKQREGRDVDVSLERLEAEFADASRYDIVASLKALEKSGKGQFLVGRRGSKSRFIWEQSARSDRARVADGNSVPAQPPAQSEVAPAKKGPAPAQRASSSSKGRAKGSETRTAAPGKARGATPSKGAALPSAPVEAAEPGSSRRAARVPGGNRKERPLLSEPAAPAPRKQPTREPARTLRHSFHLRPGALVTIELPEDVTPTEVGRFCSFLKAIPFAGSIGS